MKLASNEKMLKRWTYAATKTGRERSESTLTVTDKRIICDETSKRKVTRDEIPISEVKSLAFQKETGTGWLLIVFGLLTVIIVIGIFLVIAGIRKLLSGSFSFVISTYGEEGVPVEMGVVSVRKRGIFSRLFGGHGKKMKVKIDRDAAEDIIDTLGAIVVECRAAMGA